MSRKDQRFIENPGVDDYRRAARVGLERRDFHLAFTQIAAALSFDPTAPGSLALLDRLVREAPRGAAWLQEGEDPFFGAAAVRAHLLARRGELNEALLGLLEVVQYRPDIPYLAWIRSWLHDGAAAELRWEDLGPALSSFFERTRGADTDLAACAANMEAAVALLEALRERSAERAGATVLMTAFLRRLGRSDEALRTATAEHGRAPSFLLAMELANIHRDRGDLDAMIPSLREASERAPDEASVLVALGDELLDHDDFEPAARAFERALRVAPAHPRARPAALFARWHAEPDPALRSELGRLTRRGMDDGYGSLIEREAAELDTVLPSPLDHFSGVVADALAKMRSTPRGRRVQINVRSERPPPPSAQLALSLGGSLLGITAEMRCEGPVAEASGQGALLWTLVEGRWAPADPPPDPRVSTAVAALASTPFDDEAWARDAAALTGAFSEAERAQLLRAFVHPSPPPADWHPVRWVYVTQVATAFCIAVPGGDRVGSARRDWLCTIARGPDDYTVAAAVIALGRIARTEPAARAEVEALFADLLDLRRDGAGDSPSEHPLLVSWLRLPAVAQNQRRRLWQRRRQLSTRRSTDPCG